MIAPLTPMQSRVLALGVLALALAVGGVLLVAPIVAQYRYYDERMAELSDHLQRYANLANARSANQSALTRIKRQGAGARYYLRSEKEALASAELQQHVKRVINRSGGQLVSTQVLPSQRAELATVATVRVNMRGDIQALQKVLYALETGRPMLFLDKLSVRGGARRRLPAGASKKTMQLTVRFDASGYIRRRDA
jgi:general secretion pathway protein M